MRLAILTLLAERLLLARLCALGSDRKLSPPSFWANLQDFLTERSVKVPSNAGREVFRSDGLDSGFAESFKDFFRATPRLIRCLRHGGGISAGYRVLWDNLRDLISRPSCRP